MKSVRVAILVCIVALIPVPAAATYTVHYFAYCDTVVPERQLQTNWSRNYRYETIWYGEGHCGFNADYWQSGSFISRMKLDQIGDLYEAVAYESNGDAFWSHGNKVAISLCTWRDTDSDPNETFDNVQCYYRRHDHG